METFNSNPEQLVNQIANNYLRFDAFGDALFLDPVFGKYGEQVSPNEVPRCLLEDERMLYGLEYLHDLKERQDQNNPNISIIFTFHGCENDFSDAVDNFGAILQDADVIGVETDWISNDDGLPIPPVEILLTDAPEGRRQFQQAQIDWAEQNNKILVPCEYEERADTQLARGLVDTWKAHEKAYEIFAHDQSLYINHRVAALIYCYQFTRQLAMPTQLGYWLGKLTEEGVIGPDSKSVLVVGSGHATMPERLEKLVGLKVNTFQSPLAQEQSASDPYFKNIIDVFKTGKLTSEQARIKYPY